METSLVQKIARETILCAFGKLKSGNKQYQLSDDAQGKLIKQVAEARKYNIANYVDTIKELENAVTKLNIELEQCKRVSLFY